ncbi:FtsH protease activity modulator HflK [Candidatus Legionella polyplacis]|uniref:FtsH protease activity modulator HflK n=1 Tax=Candidatus Legionella polyplacis TaxID=2005262 RepID=UPI000C1DF0E7|nr:FtsH protease activity modulator HflK [Candidatus Legionella polyplacis]ATW01736.1 FtsH protease activity modulator HflK [Candidatus Legionella polyplacis]
MNWNNSSNKDKDPWNGKRYPPDLDEICKKFYRKFNELFFRFFGKINKTNNFFTLKKGKFIFLMSILVVFILWVLSGIFIVNPAEEAVILRFGKYIKTVGPGPHWIPYLFSYKVIKNVDRILDYSYSAQMLTRDENLVSVSLAVQYRIGDLRAYLFNVVNPEESLQQATSSALRQVVGNTSLDQIITAGREIWGKNVKETLIKIISRYKTGIYITNVSPQPARAPENVQDAFDDAIKAQEDEKRFKEQALAYQAKVIPIAEGKAKRIIKEAIAYSKQLVLQAKGEVSEFLYLLPEYKMSPKIIAKRMYLDMMQSVLKKVSKIVIDIDSRNFIYYPLNKLLLSNSFVKKKMILDEYKVKNKINNGNLNKIFIKDKNFRKIYRSIRVNNGIYENN